MALINLRNALMTGKRLPYDSEAEYLESTGTQWIDTGVLAGQDIKIEAHFYRDASPSQFAYGVRSGSTTICCATGYGSTESISGYVRWGSTAYTAAIPPGDVVISQDKNGVVVNGRASAYTATQTVVSLTGYTIALFAAKNSATTVTANLYGKIYYCKIWDNGVLVRDFIPVRKGTVGYLYDRVTGRLFGNAGTGDFVLGPDVVPVEYIESHGTEWIDTGVNANSNLKVDCRFKMLETPNDFKWLFAARVVDTAGNGYGFGCNAGGYLTSDYNGRVSSSTKLQNGEIYNIVKDGNVCQVNDITITNTSTTFTQSRKLPIWGLITANGNMNTATIPYSQCYRFRVYASEDIIRSFLPVRVGTDATLWEGAMMDVLTRRIYRNAGTGAFAYGNDLKYPIPAA